MKTLKFTAVLTASLFALNANAQKTVVEIQGDPALEGPAKKEHRQLVPFLKGRLWGFSDIDKNIVIEPKFESVEFFDEHGKMYYANGIINGKKIIITEDGKFINDEFSDDNAWGAMMLGELESEGDIYIEDMSEDKSLDKNGLHGYKYDREKDVLKISPVYKNFLHFIDEGKMAVAVLKSNGKVGVITPEGKIVIPFIYDGYSGVVGAKGELLVLKKGEKKGLVNLAGKEIIPFEYKTIQSVNYNSTRLLLTKEKNNSGALISILVNTANKKLFEDELLEAEYSGGLIKASTAKNRLFGYVDANGKTVIPFKYSTALLFGAEPAAPGFAKVTNTNGVSFFINDKGVEYYSEK